MAETKALTKTDKIKEVLTKESTLKYCISSLGNKEKAEKYIKSFLITVLNPESNLTNCTPDSLLRCMFDAVNMGLHVDSRQQAHPVRYGNEAKLLIGFRGYIAKLKEANPTTDVKTGLVWEGDEFSYHLNSTKDEYTYKPQKPFRSDYDNIIGAFCYISYQIGGILYGKIEVMEKSEIEKIKDKVPCKTIWSDWYGEQVKKTLIKRASKINFAGAIADIETHDNQNYIFDKPKTDKVEIDYSKKAEMPKSKEDAVIDVNGEEVK